MLMCTLIFFNASHVDSRQGHFKSYKSVKKKSPSDEWLSPLVCEHFCGIEKVVAWQMISLSHEPFLYLSCCPQVWHTAQIHPI